MCQDSDKIAVVLTYDLNTTFDPNVNNEVKDILTSEEWGWHDFLENEDGSKTMLPSTILITICNNLEEAGRSFILALNRYNDKHLDDKPQRRMAHCNRAVVFEVNQGKILAHEEINV